MMHIRTLSCAFFLLCSIIVAVSAVGLEELFTWTRINYDWTGYPSSRNTRQVISRSGYFKPVSDFTFPGETNVEMNRKPGEGSSGAPASADYQYVNNIPMGANVWRNKLFITVPRRRLGVPSTLNYVPLDSRNKHNVPLIPYPNWSVNIYPAENTRTNNLVSVYRVAVDSCDRLWMVDTGVIEIPGNITQIQPTRIIIIDLNTDKIIHRYEMPSHHIRQNTNLASITIDIPQGQCENAYAYMPDLGGYRLNVYSLREDKSWGISHNYFYLEPGAGEFSIGGHQFQWNDGIFSVELSDANRDGHRDMYFHSMAGTSMYKVSTKILRDENLATRSYHRDDFKMLGDKGMNSQTSSADIHKPSGIMFLGLVNQNALGCWNTRSNIKEYDVVKKDNNKMIYPCDVKVVGDKVYLLTNNMPRFLYGALNYDEVNFRVWVNTVSDAIKGTKCAGSR